ncbi:nitrous oxide reductase family maturation protein NosD [Thermoplasmatota archaeon]
MKSKKLVIIICMLIVTAVFPFVISSVASDGNIIYVDDDAPTDWYDETHVKTIQEGIDISSDGDTIFVYSGTYFEHIIIGSKSITIQGENKETTIIDGAENDDVVTISNNNVIIREFTIRNSSNIRSGIYLNQFVAHITISDNIILDNNHAIYAPYSTTGNLIISNNNINSNKYGITSYANPITISSNEIYQDTKQICIELFGINNSLITDNVLYSYKSGIVIYEGNNNIISHNNIYLKGGSLGKGIHLRLLGDNNIITYNNISGTTTKSGRGISLEMREAPSGELQGQEVSFNTISDLWGGVIIQYSPKNPRIWRNEIVNNNFIGTSRPGHFQNALGNKWYGNYWGNPKFTPYKISGSLQFHNIRQTFTWFQVDLHPRLLPINIVENDLII